MADDPGQGPDDIARSPTTWPENWRDIAAGGDQKTLQYLNRYASPANVVKALMSMRSKMDSGEMVRSRPEGDPSDPAVKEALDEWRAQAGIPESPEGYLEKLPEGLVIGEDDKDLAQDFLKEMHEGDAPPDFVHRALAWHQKLKETEAARQTEADNTFRAQAEDDLRSEWGTEYRANVNGISSLIDEFGSADLKQRLYAARMADGVPLGNDPEFLRFMVALDKRVRPHGTVTPPAGQTATQHVASRKAELQKMMRDPQSDYHRGPNAAALQEEYREIIDAESRLKGAG